MLFMLFPIVPLLITGLLVLVYFVSDTQRIARKAEQLAPPLGTYLFVDGHRIHYVDEGEGPPILFLHGLGGQLRQFTHTLFPALKNDFRLIAIDLPGSGYSLRARHAPARPTSQARAVAHVIDALKLDKVLVVGHSLGGAVALALALDHPDKVAGVAALAPLTHHDPSVPRDLSPLYIPSPLKRKFLAHTFAIPAAKRQAEPTLAYIFGPQPVPASYMVGGGGWVGLRPSHFAGSAADYVAIAEDFPALAERYHELKMPVGILFGTADKVIDFEKNGVAMKQHLPDVDFEPLEGIGHMPQFVATERTVAFIRRMAAKAFALPGRQA